MITLNKDGIMKGTTPMARKSTVSDIDLEIERLKGKRLEALALRQSDIGKLAARVGVLEFDDAQIAGALSVLVTADEAKLREVETAGVKYFPARRKKSDAQQV